MKVFVHDCPVKAKLINEYFENYSLQVEPHFPFSQISEKINFVIYSLEASAEAIKTIHLILDDVVQREFFEALITRYRNEEIPAIPVGIYNTVLIPYKKSTFQKRWKVKGLVFEELTHIWLLHSHHILQIAFLWEPQFQLYGRLKTNKLEELSQYTETLSLGLSEEIITLWREYKVHFFELCNNVNIQLLHFFLFKLLLQIYSGTTHEKDIHKYLKWRFNIVFDQYQISNFAHFKENDKTQANMHFTIDSRSQEIGALIKLGKNALLRSYYENLIWCVIAEALGLEQLRKKNKDIYEKLRDLYPKILDVFQNNDLTDDGEIGSLYSKILNFYIDFEKEILK